MAVARGQSTRSAPPTRGVEHALARHRKKYEDEVERLVEATLQVMREREGADPTVSDILARAGLSTSAFYRHFPTKDDLFVTLLERAHHMTAAHIAKRLEVSDRPQERIEIWVRAIFDLVRTPTAVVQNRPLLLAHPRLMQQFPQEINAGFDALARPLQLALVQARTESGVPVGDAATDARLALHQVFSILIDAAAMGTPPARPTIDAVVAYTRRAALGNMPATTTPARAAGQRRS